MNHRDILDAASGRLHALPGHVFDVLSLAQPTSPAAAANLSKIVSKLSPLLGNLIELDVVEFLNEQKEFAKLGRWQRQDPGFPDTVFIGSVSPTPGFEIKAWSPLATEITARFRESQKNLNDATNVCILAWLPEMVIFGKPRIVDVCIVSGRSIALTRDQHYHNPPDYVVLEPEDTRHRTANLQQTNTNGLKWQGSHKELQRANKLVESWGPHARRYKLASNYQVRLRELVQRYKYRLDTNYAKIDRIAHKEIEAFKTRVMTKVFHGRPISDWNALLSRGSNEDIREAMKMQFGIK